MHDVWDTAAFIQKYPGQLVILHGTEDQTILPENTQFLINHAQATNKRRVSVSGARHNTMWRNKIVQETLRNIVKDVVQ